MMQSILPVKIGQVWIVLDPLLVHEIVGAQKWVPIPHASADAPGVVAWRGRAVAVLDLARVAATAETLTPSTERPRTVIVEARGCTLAIPVDVVHEVKVLPGGTVRASHGTRMRHSSSEVDVFGAPVPVLDLDSVVESLLAVSSVDGA
jgi:chemotaxis signal transduction protein